MGKIQCPYCFSYKTLAIVCTDNIQPKESKYYKDKCNVKRIEKGEAILSNTNLHYSKEYDGKIIKRRTYDRFCSVCKKPFYYISNMILSDIKVLTFIIETSTDKWKYEIHLDEEKSYYNIDHNFITKSYMSSLTPARKRKILEGLDKSQILKSEPSKLKNYFDYKIKWNVYVDYYDGQTFSRGGYDEYPKGWNYFIDPFIRVFKNDILKKMREPK